MRVETVKKRIYKLRQMASIGQEPSTHEPLRLFKEINADKKCNIILKDVTTAIKDELVIEEYNRHIERSSLSTKEKKQLLIQI